MIRALSLRSDLVAVAQLSRFSIARSDYSIAYFLVLLPPSTISAAPPPGGSSSELSPTGYAVHEAKKRRAKQVITWSFPCGKWLHMIGVR